MSHDGIDWNAPASAARVRANLRKNLRRRYSRIEEHLLEESIEDALLHYKNHPERFDASRGASLYYYLELRTRHYLDKRLQKAKRRGQHEKVIGTWDKFFEEIMSERKGKGGINKGRNKVEQESEERAEETEKRKEALDAILASLNPQDRAGVELLRTGASREEWIRHLEIKRLPENEQRRKIYAEKDRLMKKLKRRARKIQGG